MISRFEYHLLEKSGNFYLASEILECFKNRTAPSSSLLQQMYGVYKAETINREISDYFSENKIPEDKEPRPHDYDCPVEISNARRALEEDKHYLNVQHYLLKNQVPELLDLTMLYGKYSEYIREIYDKFNILGLKRKCGLPASSHLNRVGGVSVKLNFNLPGCYEYSAVAAIHDAIEDLFPILLVGNEHVYDFSRYKEFMDKYIPENLQHPIRILTNHYNMIVSNMVRHFKNNDIVINKKNVMEHLETLMSREFDKLDIYIRQMHEILLGDNFDKEKDIIEHIRWRCYIELYLQGITKSSISSKDFRLFEIKGVDLSDNAHGKDALSLDGRIRNIKKSVNWANYGYGMHSSWKPLNNHIQECMEDSYLSSEVIILKDLLRPQSSMDFIMSSLIIFSKLEEVFYVSKNSGERKAESNQRTAV